MTGRLAVVLLALLWRSLPAAVAGQAEPPQRVMSLNLCVDQLLMELLPDSRLVSITWLSRSEGDPALLERARRLPVNHGSAEEVLRARPDLVVAGRFTTGTTRELLRRAGIPLLVIDPASDWEGIRAVTRQVAAATGATARGEQLVAEMDAHIAAAIAARPADPVRVIGWGGAGSDVPGRDTLFNTILETAGGMNLAAREHAAAAFDVEQVLRERPELLMRGAAYAATPALRNEAALHPALRKRYGQRMISYPEAVYGCGVPRAAELAHELALRLSDLRASSP